MAATPPPLRVVRCPNCGERLGVRAEDVGKKARCRECGTVFRVGGPAVAAAPAIPGKPVPALPEGAPSQERVAAAPKMPETVSFPCEVCQTRLTTAVAHVGKKLSCPDCGHASIVPPPVVVKPTSAPAAMSGAQYGLWDIGAEPAATRLDEINKHLHPVVCELCQTLMYATDEQVGQRLKCPDCHHLNVVHARPVAKPTESALVPDGEEYELDETSAPPPRPLFVPLEERAAEFRDAARQRAGVVTDREPPTSKPRGIVAAEPTSPLSQAPPPPLERVVVRQSTRPKRPAVPLVQGVMRMLLTSEMLVRWVGQSLALTIILRLGLGILNAMGNQALFILPLFAAALFIGGVWLLSTLPLWMSIVMESSEGNDQLEDPPSWMAFDVAQTGFMAIAMATAAFPAWLTTKATAPLEAQWQLAIAAAIWLAGFPFMLLSALEQNSAFALFSPRMAYSLIRCAGPWLAFVMETFALAAGAAYLVWRALIGPAWLFYVLPWLATAAALLYMRLIGRLAWWVAEVMPASEEGEVG